MLNAIFLEWESNLDKQSQDRHRVSNIASFSADCELDFYRALRTSLGPLLNQIQRFSQVAIPYSYVECCSEV